MTKLTIEEKRLHALRQQLFGKETTIIPNTPNLPNSPKTLNFSKETHSNEEKSYLKQDLSKILILSIVAFTIQILLYLASSKGLLVLGL